MSTLQFNGAATDYIQIADSADFSVATISSLTMSAWMRPDVLTFPNSEGTKYAHWVGKGEAGQQVQTRSRTGLHPNLVLRFRPPVRRGRRAQKRHGSFPSSLEWSLPGFERPDSRAGRLDSTLFTFFENDYEFIMLGCALCSLMSFAPNPRANK
jgi:hypothetical protein